MFIPCISLLLSVILPLISANCNDANSNRYYMDEVLDMGITSGDRNRDGHLSNAEIRDEFCGGQSWPRCNRPQQMSVQSIMRNADNNPFDGRVNQNELRRYLGTIQGRSLDNYISMNYRYLDQDGNGILKRGDFMYLARKFCSNKSLGIIACGVRHAGSAIQTFNHFDCNRDGSISYQEMRTVANSAFRQFG